MKRLESSSTPRRAQVYGVITADLVESRRLTNRALVQRQLLNLVHGSSFSRLPQKVTGKPGLLTAGAYIGMVERFLLTSLVASNQFGVVGFVWAAKSIAR